MDIISFIIYGVFGCLAIFILIVILKIGLIFALNILSGILKLLLLPFKIVATFLIYILFFNSPYRALKIDNCNDTMNYIPNLLLDLADWFEDILNGDFTWFTIKFGMNEEARRIYNEYDFDKPKKKKKKKSNNDYSGSDYDSNSSYSNNSRFNENYSNSNSSNSNKVIFNQNNSNNEYEQQKAKQYKNIIESELNKLYSRYNQIYRDNKLNLQRKNKLQYGIDERFSNLHRNSVNLDKRINEAIAIAYYLESNDLIKFRDEKIMYPNVMKNI